MSREISLMSLVLNWPSYTRSLDEENFGGTTQTFIWLPYYSAIQKKKPLPGGFRIRELKENGHFFGGGSFVVVAM